MYDPEIGGVNNLRCSLLTTTYLAFVGAKKMNLHLLLHQCFFIDFRFSSLLLLRCSLHNDVHKKILVVSSSNTAPQFSTACTGDARPGGKVAATNAGEHFSRVFQQNPHDNKRTANDHV